jgi:hypothetical protein
VSTVTTVSTARAARIQAIRQGAEVRQALGQAATHELLSDGRHVVRLRGRVGAGQSVAAAIANIREEPGT